MIEANIFTAKEHIVIRIATTRLWRRARRCRRLRRSGRHLLNCFDCPGIKQRHDTVFAIPDSLSRLPGFVSFNRRAGIQPDRSEEHTSELQSLAYLVCRLLLEKKKN